MDLKVIEPIVQPVKEFKSLEEFDGFLQKNLDTLPKLSTQYLNKIYKISVNGENYKIIKTDTRSETGAKQAGKICLKKMCCSNHVEKNEEISPPKDYSDEICELQEFKDKMVTFIAKNAKNNQKIKELENKIAILDETLKKVVDAINGES